MNPLGARSAFLHSYPGIQQGLEHGRAAGPQPVAFIQGLQLPQSHQRLEVAQPRPGDPRRAVGEKIKPGDQS